LEHSAQPVVVTVSPKKERNAKMKSVLAASVCALALIAMPVAADTPEAEDENGEQQQQGQQGSATATFINQDGEEIGTGTLTGTAEGVLMELEVDELPSDQWVSLGIHEGMECDPEDNFETAGEPFNPEDRDFGYLSDNGPHAGALPNQYVPEDGTMRAHIFNSFIRLTEADDAQQQQEEQETENDENDNNEEAENAQEQQQNDQALGGTIVIHDGESDYESYGDQERIACAVIEMD
jgi:superoxide dismutase, Cu-Zn family